MLAQDAGDKQPSFYTHALKMKKFYSIGHRAIKLAPVLTIDIGLEQGPFVVFVYFFPHLNMQKNVLFMGPNNTKNSSKSVIFSYLTMNNIVRILFLL